MDLTDLHELTDNRLGFTLILLKALLEADLFGRLVPFAMRYSRLHGSHRPLPSQSLSEKLVMYSFRIATGG